MKILSSKNWFSLIEVLMGVLIFSMVMTGAFYALSSVNIGKVKLIEETSLEKEAFYFSEVLFDFIKQGGTTDFEEYFNRQTINTGVASLYSSGHYVVESNFWNGSSTMFYCISKDASSMFPRTWTATGCLDDFNTDSLSTLGANYHTDVFSLADKSLLYNQYLYQFIDYNSDADSDGGDENSDGNINRDNDDEFVGDGPEVFWSDGRVYEVYLISWSGDTRTFLRWNVTNDPDAPSFATCNGLSWVPTSISWEGCLGTFEYLKLKWVDWGYDHNDWVQDVTQYDGIIDTWIYDPEIYWLSTNIVADASNDDDYRISLFPDSMNVKNVNFFLYPNKDIRYAWKDFSDSVNINPYIQIKLTLSPSRNKRKWIKWKLPEYTFNTTISLTDIYSK